MKRYHHLRAKLSKGGVTVVTEYSPSNNTTTIKYSICSIRDNYNKKLGIQSAQSSTNFFSVEGQVNTDSQVLSLLCTNVDNETRYLIVKSILHSMSGRKLTPTSIDDLRRLYLSNSHAYAVYYFIEKSINKNLRPSLKEITLLWSLLQFV